MEEYVALRQIEKLDEYCGMEITEGSAPMEVARKVIEIGRLMKGADDIKVKLTKSLGYGLYWLNKNWDDDCKWQFGNFTNFLKKELVKKIGVSPSTCYNAMGCYKSFPSLPVEKWVEIGTTNLVLLKGITKEGEPSCQKLLDLAATMTGRELLQAMHENGEVDRGEILRAVLIVKCSQNTASHWREFMSDSGVISHVGTTDEGAILDALLANGEASGWRSGEVYDENIRSDTPGVVN